MEIEKSFNRSAISGSGDSGTSSRSFATLLTWLGEHKSPVFVVATTNDHTRLPPEFIRKGRFDDIFWTDLPSIPEREEIFKVLLERYGRDVSKTKLNLKKLAAKTEGFTGAEIEQLIVGTMFTRFDRDGKEFSQVDLEDEISSTKPSSITSKEDIDKMRQQAVNKLRVASTSGASHMFTLSENETRTDNSELRNLDVS